MAIDWAIVLSILAALGTLYTAIATRTKAKAEAESSIASSALAFVNTMRQEMSELKAENEKLRTELNNVVERLEVVEKENEELKSGILLLCHQVESLGRRPIWQPGQPEKEVKHGVRTVPAPKG